MLPGCELELLQLVACVSVAGCEAVLRACICACDSPAVLALTTGGPATVLCIANSSWCRRCHAGGRSSSCLMHICVAWMQPAQRCMRVQALCT